MNEPRKSEKRRINRMEKCLCATIDMPISYSLMDENDMTYVEGGGSATVTDTARKIRNKITAGTAGIYALDAAVVGASFAISGIAGAILSQLASADWIDAWLDGCSSASAQVEDIIRRKGLDTLCNMTTTYSFGWRCTGITVTVA